MIVSDEDILVNFADIETDRADNKAFAKSVYKSSFYAKSIFPLDITAKEFNQRENTILLQEIIKRFDKGLPFSYQDERSNVKGKNFFISANPDGSEYLMRMDNENNARKMVKVEILTPKKKGKYYLRLYGG